MKLPSETCWDPSLWITKEGNGRPACRKINFTGEPPVPLLVRFRSSLIKPGEVGAYRWARWSRFRRLPVCKALIVRRSPCPSQLLLHVSNKGEHGGAGTNSFIRLIHEVSVL